MEYYKIAVELIGHIAWPLVAVFIFLWLVKEINAGLLQKIFKDGGSLMFGGRKYQFKKAWIKLRVKLKRPEFK